MAGFNKLMRYCDTLAEYEAAKANGTVTDDTLVIVVQDKVAKFKGETFDWSGGGGADTSTLATKEEVIDNEEVTATAFADIAAKYSTLKDKVHFDYATKAEVNAIKDMFLNEIVDNEEIVAKALSLLESRLSVIENIT